MDTGYLHPLYADAFAEFGRPVALEHSGGWVLERSIAGSHAVDAMGLYPLCCCRNWDALRIDLEAQGDRWVSLSMVTDPFGAYDEALLRDTFDVVIPYKDHYVADTSEPLASFVSKSHRKNARRALNQVAVEVCDDPASRTSEWVELFGVLAKKHDICGLRAFSPAAFEKQLRVPGMVMFRASHEGRTVGLDLWYVQDGVAQGHLVAFNEEGYELSASYATKWTLLNYFAGKTRWVNFGGVPDGESSAANGLGHFKRAWANTTRKAYFCGRVFDRKTYDALAARAGETKFFPAYRAKDPA